MAFQSHNNFFYFSWLSAGRLNRIPYKILLITMRALSWNDTLDWEWKSLRNILVYVSIMVRAYGLRKIKMAQPTLFLSFFLPFKKVGYFFLRQMKRNGNKQLLRDWHSGGQAKNCMCEVWLSLLALLCLAHKHLKQKL